MKVSDQEKVAAEVSDTDAILQNLKLELHVITCRIIEARGKLAKLHQQLRELVNEST